MQTWKGFLFVHSQLPRLLSPWANGPATLDDALCNISPMPLEWIDSWKVRSNSALSVSKLNRRQDL